MQCSSTKNVVDVQTAEVTFLDQRSYHTHFHRCITFSCITFSYFASNCQTFHTSHCFFSCVVVLVLFGVTTLLACCSFPNTSYPSDPVTMYVPSGFLVIPAIAISKITSFVIFSLKMRNNVNMRNTSGDST